MTTENHPAPAPWHFSFSTCNILDSNGELICECFGDQANAYLIRTAPELLKALKKLVAECELAALEAGDSDTSWLDAAREAILRAELYRQLTYQPKENLKD